MQNAEVSSDEQDLQRRRLLNSTARIESSTDRLANSHRIALETEQIGAGIIGDLKMQTEQLQRTKATLEESEGYVDRSLRILKDMSRRYPIDSSELI